MVSIYKYATMSSMIASYLGARVSSCYNSCMSLWRRNYYGFNIIHHPDQRDKLQIFDPRHLSPNYQNLLRLSKESSLCEMYSFPEEKGNICTDCKDSSECKLLYPEDFEEIFSFREDL